ncbi:tRNA (N6-threonylcarbamoyladenosine(37)-N6)-methyltransferase TrmO [Fibrobacter sp. UWEL]|uniref:tRNA (N6-threonylcarbamoyladenosine(37)-N6)-methyltransferase TrmO n=1 Tax=Fibrobacter sp. UWEL TaxID=1896209 RepID=UPI00091EC889|nr:tRNA (N6-threonylcarbamoyladenosine(37)-N6)-methyltransferase TrmO [Fibrobacter sp. UWEL]SHL42443.1 tRNA-Thr(GGU) m(6)t(6)A37 methyltransferase TsaA [Fibrobacter sp. UWEL]
MEVNPIGTFFGDAVYKYDAPRQGRLFAGHPGRIVLNSGCNFEMALRDLDGFERIWVIFQFHENEGWRPTTRPPVPAPGRDRVGTFASRSPYRPNSIGLSCVRLLKVDGLTLYVDEADLLNETPVLDVKPYIPMADAFPNAKAGWVDEQEGEKWSVETSEKFAAQNQWIGENSEFDLMSFALVQLGRGGFSNGVFDGTRRRLTLDENTKTGVLAYRTFRIDFIYDENTKSVTLQAIRSGYSKDDLEEGAPDKWGDKPLHRNFLKKF